MSIRRINRHLSDFVHFETLPGVTRTCAWHAHNGNLEGYVATMSSAECRERVFPLGRVVSVAQRIGVG
jgi:hypothetical protein